MAVSKRLRFEILRRDNHTCRYCGASAPDVKLTVDHVLPEALGGRDEPENLVTACDPCNSGKSSVPPEAALVAEVKTDAIRFARALKAVAQARAELQAERDAYVDVFREEWSSWGWGFNQRETFPVPDSWRETIERFYEVGLSVEELVRAARKALGNDRVGPDQTFRYFCGICWSIVREIQEAATDLVMAELNDEMLGTD